MRGFIVVIACVLAYPLSTSAEVTSVTIISRTLLAGGQSFGATGSYERLVGRIEFALDRPILTTSESWTSLMRDVMPMGGSTFLPI